MGFDFLKKLFGEVKSIDDVIKAITPEKNEKNDEEESSSAKSNLNNVFSFTQVTNSVTWNGKLYGVKDSTIVVSNNDGESGIIIPLFLLVAKILKYQMIIN